MVIRPPLLDFSAGELSPKLAGRIDSPVYYKGCQRLTNFFPRITGGMGKRPGFVWVGESLGPGRLIPWTPIAGLVFNIELTASHIRLWCNDSLVTDLGGITIDIVGPGYTLAEIPYVKYCQIKDQILLIHPAHAPYKFAYVTHSWTGGVLNLSLTAGAPSFIYGNLWWNAPTVIPWPASDLWDKVAQWLTLEKTYSATAGTTFNSKTLSSITRFSGYLHLVFSDTSTLDLSPTSLYTYQGTIAVDLQVFSGTGEYPSSCTLKNGRVYLGGSVNEPNVVYASKPNDQFNFIIFETIEIEKVVINENNYQFTGRCDGDTIYDLTSTDIVQMHAGDQIAGIGGDWSGFLSMFNYLPTVLAVNVLGLCVKCSRQLGVSGVKSLVRKWATDDIPEYSQTQDQVQQIGPASAMKLIMATEENEAIQWLAAGQDIIVGTASSEFAIAGASTATNATAALTGRCGSMNLQARFIRGDVYFIQASGTMVRIWTPDGKSPAVNALADHILKSGVVAFDYSSDPEACLWVVCADGFLYRCSLEGETPSWSRISTRDGDLIKSVSVLPGADGDMVYVLVYRNMGGSWKTYLEKLDSSEDETYDDRLYLDCATKKTNLAAFTTVSGLSRFNGMTVTYYAGHDEASMVKGTGIVTAGVLSGLPAGTLCAYVGLLYTASMKTHRLETAETEGLRKTVPSIHFRLYRCGPFTVKWSDDSAKSTDLVTPIGIYTGAIKKTRESGSSTDQTIIIESSDPWPIGIQAIVPEIAVAQLTTGGQ